jgi:hypothetical protein
VNDPDPYALALDTPADLARRRLQVRSPGAPAAGEPAAQLPANGAPKTRPSTETLAARAGALSDEIDFPAFVAGLVHGTFGAMVDASIRQMEEFAELVSAVAKDVDQFTNENVTPAQARDWLRDRYPQDLGVEVAAEGASRLRSLRPEDDEAPAWLADFGLEGEQLTDELVEERLVPAARRAVGESRLQLLATMVMLGMNRINVRDGRVAARVRFRAAARDRAEVDLAVQQPGATWGERGSATYANVSTMVSTVGVNAQADTDLKAELFGEVEINFASETLPLDRFVDSARLALLERNARRGLAAPATAPAAALPAAPAPTPPAAPAAAPPAAPAPAPPAPGGTA